MDSLQFTVVIIKFKSCDGVYALLPSCVCSCNLAQLLSSAKLSDFQSIIQMFKQMNEAMYVAG